MLKMQLENLGEIIELELLGCQGLYCYGPRSSSVWRKHLVCQKVLPVRAKFQQAQKHNNRSIDSIVPAGLETAMFFQKSPRTLAYLNSR
ncbi:hypothetical protein ACET3Z_028308 [Daucus carota]